MNYYPYGGSGSLQPSDKVGVPGIYGSSMAYPQQGGLPPGHSPAGLQPSAQHFTSIGSTPGYPASSIYASSLQATNPYGSAVAGNPYVRSPGALGAPHGASAGAAQAAAAAAYSGYTASPYAGQAVSPTYRSPMMAVPATSYPGTSYSVGSGAMLGYHTGTTTVRSPAGFPTVGGYPTGLPAGIPGYQSSPSQQQVHPGHPHPGYAPVPTYPGGSPFVMSRQLP